MKRIIITASYLVACSLLVVSLDSCKSCNSNNGVSSTDSVTSTTTVTTTTTTSGGDAVNGDNGNNSNKGNNSTNGTSGTSGGNSAATESDAADPMVAKAIAMEPMGPMRLTVTSTAFEPYNVIPAKYTCEGQGVTPPLTVRNMPPGTKSLALILHDYHATPDGGETYWMIWNLDTVGNIPENFRSDYMSVNKANEYGYTPICAKAGNHKYHFIVYALDSRLLLGKKSTKQNMEKVMRGHVLAKGDLVGIYNKQLE